MEHVEFKNRHTRVLVDQFGVSVPLKVRTSATGVEECSREPTVWKATVSCVTPRGGEWLPQSHAVLMSSEGAPCHSRSPRTHNQIQYRRQLIETFIYSPHNRLLFDSGR